MEVNYFLLGFIVFGFGAQFVALVISASYVIRCLVSLNETLRYRRSLCTLRTKKSIRRRPVLLEMNKSKGIDCDGLPRNRKIPPDPSLQMTAGVIK